MLTVALGASAGGLSALAKFFAHVPYDTQIAYLAMLDLSDGYQRQIEDALRAAVSIPVTAVREWYRIEPNNIYLIPPRRGIAFIEDHVALSESATGERLRAPVDALFHALAQSRGTRAACIVLSGTGAGGSEGLRDITEKGGFCLAQEPREAEYSEMPRNAIVTGMVEHVMSAADMPGHLVAYTRRFRPIPITGTLDDAVSTDRLDAGRARPGRDHAMQPETQRFDDAGRLELMMESDSDAAILTIDAGLKIDGWNTGAARIFGWTREQAIGQLAERILVTDDQHRVMLADVMRRAREEGRAIDERWHVRKDGAAVYLHGILTPVHDRSGAFTGYLHVACDLTEWKRREDALQSTCGELRHTTDASTQQLLEAHQRLEREVGARREADRRIRSLITRIVTVQEDERRRIQRDLHDEVGQQVSALRLKLDALGLVIAAPGLHDWIDDTRAIVSNLEHDLDSLTWQLGPSSLHELGLAVTLPGVVQEWSARCGIPVTFRAAGFDDQRLDFDIETHLYRITQEALNNILKHARATQVTVILERGNREVVLMVVDDGRGIEPAPEGSDSKDGLGLIGMRERAALVGGTLQLGNPHGSGTTVMVRVPIPQSAAGQARVS